MTDKPMHQEAHAALMTRRPQFVAMLRNQIIHGAPDSIETSNWYENQIHMLCNALEAAVADLEEKDRRLNEIERVLREQTRSLRGAADQSERLLTVVREGGTYANAEARGTYENAEAREHAPAGHKPDDGETD